MTKVLGFDTSGPYCGAALFEANDVFSALYEDMERGQAERLMPMLEEVLRARNANWGDLDAIGVGIGPGNFTGVRISVSAARGLSLSLGIPAVGVSLFDALAEEAEGDLILTLKAPRDAYYVQTRFSGEVLDIAVETVEDFPASPPGAVCVGVDCKDIASALGRDFSPAKYAPASAIARIAARRCTTPQDRPAPLYIRPADAAPPRDAPPVILP